MKEIFALLLLTSLIVTATAQKTFKEKSDTKNIAAYESVFPE
jgi:hypothetical protein